MTIYQMACPWRVLRAGGAVYPACWMPRSGQATVGLWVLVAALGVIHKVNTICPPDSVDNRITAFE